jgi:hypothetical protein
LEDAVASKLFFKENKILNTKMLIASKLHGILTIFKAAYSLWTMPAKLCIRPTNLELYLIGFVFWANATTCLPTVPLKLVRALLFRRSPEQGNTVWSERRCSGGSPEQGNVEATTFVFFFC